MWCGGHLVVITVKICFTQCMNCWFQPALDWDMNLTRLVFGINLDWLTIALCLWQCEASKAINNLTNTVPVSNVESFSLSVCQTEGSESRSGSSLSLARVRPGTISNGTSKHSTSSSSSGAPSSSSGHKAQRSASTYHRQRRHSDFCKGNAKT